jgi:hypothetical protein
MSKDFSKEKQSPNLVTLLVNPSISQTADWFRISKHSQVMRGSEPAISKSRKNRTCPCGAARHMGHRIRLKAKRSWDRIPPVSNISGLNKFRHSLQLLCVSEENIK